MLLETVNFYFSIHLGALMLTSTYDRTTVVMFPQQLSQNTCNWMEARPRRTDPIEMIPSLSTWTVVL
jgi:hypothetical protein